eukprot:IDg16212t1
MKKTNSTDSTTLTVEDPARRVAHKLATGEIFEIFSGIWDGPKAWTDMKITAENHAANFVEYCPLSRYLEV